MSEENIGDAPHFRQPWAFLSNIIMGHGEDASLPLVRLTPTPSHGRIYCGIYGVNPPPPRISLTPLSQNLAVLVHSDQLILYKMNFLGNCDCLSGNRLQTVQRTKRGIEYHGSLC